MLLGASRVLLPCLGPCQAPTAHLQRVERAHGRRDAVTFTCADCGTATTRIPVHFAYSGRTTACALPVDRTRRKTTAAPARVTCPECVAMLVGELSNPPQVDWRPTQALPEDHYAL